MALTDRPNYQALDDALSIYRDEMRPFIVRNLFKHFAPDKDNETTIRGLLNHDSFLNIGDFLLMMQSYWQDIFSGAFVNRDKDSVEETLTAISKAHDKMADSKSEDIDLDYAIECLDNIAEMLSAINKTEQSDAVRVIQSGLLPPFKTYAHKFRQGGRDVYAFPLDLETLNRTLPDRVDDRMVRDANRPLTPSHAKKIQKYLEDRRDWLLGTLLIGVRPDAIEFQSYMSDPNAETNAGELTINADGVADMKMFDGQHRRRAIKDVLRELSHNAKYSKILRELKSASLPIMLYAEANIDALQQMYADAALNKAIEANTVTIFDQRNAFNQAAQWIAKESVLFNGRVEMERARVARTSENIIAINQLARTLKTLEVGYSGRVSKERNEAYMLDLDSLYERCLEWSDDFMPAARDEYNSLMSGEIDKSEIPKKRADTMAYNATVIRVFAACCYQWTKMGYDLRTLSEFISKASLRPGDNASLLVDAGLVAPGTTSPAAQQRTVIEAIDYIIEQATDYADRH